jgi:hypothetical protein
MIIGIVHSKENGGETPPFLRFTPPLTLGAAWIIRIFTGHEINGNA